MSKTDTDLLDISRSKPTDSLNEPTFSTDREGGRTINVFDYETADGMPFMLAAKYDGEAAEIETEVVDTPDGRRMGPLTTADAVRKLHNGKTRGGALNFWYNLNFDINIFLKDLDDSTLQELRATNSAEAEVGERTLRLTYIPKKMLEIRDDSDHVSRHFDLAQFCYSGTLGDAAEDWLDGDVGKAQPSVDPTEDAWDDSLQRKTDDGVAYVGGAIERHSGEVADYAKRDVELTYDIAYEVVSTAEDEIEPAIPFGKPYSTGFVAGDFLKAHMESKVQYRSDDFQRAALKAYAGGRFEIYERGRVEDAVSGPDINSAYPAVMDSLPALANLSIGSLESFDGDAIDVLRRTYEGDDYYDLKGYGFVKARVTTDESRRIQPFAVKNEDAGRVEFPALNDGEIWTLAPIFCHAVDAGYVEEYEVLEGAAALPEGEFASEAKAYADYGVDIGNLYAKRKALEAEERYRPAKLIKIVLNSLYGKTCQIDAKRYYLENYVDENEDDIEMPDVDADDIDGWIDALPAAELPNEAELTDHIVDGNQIVEEFVAGSFFNPAVAAYTTGMTRLKLHESVVSAGIEDDVLMFATDCILTRADSFDATDLADAADSDPDKTDSAAMRDALGGWDYDYKGDDGALMVASGIYEIYDSDAENGVQKTKARGFRKLSEGDYPPIRDCLADPDEYLNDDGDISVTNVRPRTFGEVVFRGKSLRLIGEFFEDTRGLSPDMDAKRRWRRDSPTFADLSDEAEVGKPPLAGSGYDG